jgi:hypothetical protein
MEALKENKKSRARSISFEKEPFFSGDAFRKNLTISKSNDQEEKDSEEMAGQIMRTAQEYNKENTGQAFASKLDKSKGKGKSLSNPAKSQMEGTFGWDFSNIKIHSDEESTQMSKEINAKAFTSGSDIYFQTNYYNTKTGMGKRLLAHELAHTVQNQSGSAGPTIQREGEEKKDTSDDKSKVETKVEVVTEHKEGESKAKATTTRSGEEDVAKGVTAKATEKTTEDAVTTSAELKAKEKSSGLSVTGGIKAEETISPDPEKPDKAKGYFKVGGNWTLFDKKLKLDSSISAETDFKSALSISFDNKAVFFPNGRLSPEIAAKFILDDKGPSAKISPGVSLRITDILSAKAGVPINIDSDGKIKPGLGLGLVIKL